MTFFWPEMLWLLLARAGARGRLFLSAAPQAAEPRSNYASLSMVKDAMGRAQKFRRHLPPLLFLLALIAMLVAVGRPAAVVSLPSQHQTIILAMDVSGSMRAVDVQPNRLAAAQAAAKSLRRRATAPTYASAWCPSRARPRWCRHPTHNREDIVAAIDRFQLQRGTAIGSGIIVSLATIFPDAGIDVSSLIYGRNPPRGMPLDAGRQSGKAGVQAGARPAPTPRPRSFCLPTASAPPAPTPWKRRRWPPTAACASSPSASAPKAGETIGFEGWSMRVRLDEDTLKSDRQHDPRPIFLRRHRHRSEKGLRLPQLQIPV